MKPYTEELKEQAEAERVKASTLADGIRTFITDCRNAQSYDWMCADKREGLMVAAERLELLLIQAGVEADPCAAGCLHEGFSAHE